MDATVLALAGLLRIEDGDRTRFEFKELQAPNKKKKNNKKKKKAPSREEVVVANGGEHSNSNGSSSITWGEVKTFYFKWAIGHCAVPAKGGTPLGLGDEEESMQEQVTVDKHQSLLASSLLVRARERGVPVGSIKDSEKPHGVSSSKGKEDWDVLLETRQRDFKKSNNKNPLYGPLTEEERVVVLSKTIREQGGRSYSIGDHSDSSSRMHTNRSGSIDSSSSNSSIRAPLNRSGSIDSNSRAPTNRSGSIDSTSSTQSSLKDDGEEVSIADLNRELRKIRESREHHMGCSCRPIKIDKLSVVKMKTELMSHHGFQQGAVDDMSKTELAATLKTSLKDCPLCIAQNCVCVELGVECRADTCECLRRRELQTCANPNGSVIFDSAAIAQYRESVLVASK